MTRFVVNRIPTLTNQVPRGFNGNRGEASDRTDRIRDNVYRENLSEDSQDSEHQYSNLIGGLIVVIFRHICT